MRDLANINPMKQICLITIFAVCIIIPLKNSLKVLKNHKHQHYSALYIVTSFQDKQNSFDT